MKKEVRNYLSIGFLVLAALILAYLFNLRMTGYVSLLPEYGNQTDCVDAGYVWEVLIGPDCTNITTDVNEIGWINSTGYTFVGSEGADNFVVIAAENITNPSAPVPIPVIEYSLVSATGVVTNATSAIYFNVNFTYTYNETSCVDVVIEERCVGDVCGADFLDLCLDETNCTDVEVGNGSWYDGNCYDEQPVCAVGFLELCLDETNCVGVGYWYDSVCNVNECATDSHCDSGYECDAGSCEVIVEDTGDTEDTEDTGPEFNPYTVTRASLGNIQEITLNQGGSKEVSMIVTNTGTGVLSSCILKPLGEYDSWILVSEEAISINIEDQHEFSFNVIVPEETEEGSYSLKVSVDECLGTAMVKAFTVNIEEKKLEFNIISADRTRDDRVRILYSLEELSGNNQDVVFIFSLVDANNVEVGRVEVNQSINANSSDEFRTNIEINESLLPINETTNETLESELTLHVNFNSQIYSSSIQEKVLIGTPIGGFAIFEGVGAGEAILFIVVLFVLVFIFVFARRMRRQGKTLRSLLNRK